MSNKEGKTENCRGSTLYMATIMIIKERVILSAKKTSKITGGKGIIIITTMVMTARATSISL
jgi:hypothetical protein